MAQTSMQKFIISVVIIGVILVIGIFIAASIQDATRTANTAGSANNETLTTVTEAGEYLTPFSYNDVVCTLLIVTNASDGTVIPSSNYTQSNCNLMNAATATTFNNTDWNVSYTYTYSADSNTSVAAGDLVTALSGGSAWVTIVIVVGFATIVLGMLTQGLGRKREDELESGYVY